MKKRRLITIVLLFVTAGGMSHLSILGQTDSASFKEYVRDIKSGDSPATVMAAGESVNKSFIPVLRSVLHKKNYPNKGEAEIALAKLGDTAELQEFYCAIAVGNETEVDNSIGSLRYIGGAFSFRIIKDVLGEQLASGPMKPDPQAPSDVLMGPPTSRAVQSFQQLLPKAQVQENHRDYKPWLEYLDQHWSELSKLEPTGEGVEFSLGACNHGKKRSRTSN